jgi:hypothetical protein
MQPSTSGSGDDAPAQTNLGLLLQRALAAQQSTGAAEQEKPAEPGPEPEPGTKYCADCWNALTFKDERGRQMARCAKDLWVKPAVTYEELNSHRVRRWYADCPEYDDSE